MAFSSQGRRQPLAEINVTPFVDVMLVLLVVFMVTAPMMKNQLPIELPEVRSVPIALEDSKLLLTIDADRRIWLGEEELPADRIDDTLLGNTRLREESELYIQADAALSYGFVTKIIGLAQAAGIKKVGLVTQPGDPQTAPLKTPSKPLSSPPKSDDDLTPQTR